MGSKIDDSIKSPVFSYEIGYDDDYEMPTDDILYDNDSSHSARHGRQRRRNFGSTCTCRFVMVLFLPFFAGLLLGHLFLELDNPVDVVSNVLQNRAHPTLRWKDGSQSSSDSVKSAVTQIKSERNEKGSSIDASSCCYQMPLKDLKSRMTKEFMEHQIELKPNYKGWSGHEYQDWLKIESTVLTHRGQPHRYQVQNPIDICEAEWQKVVLDQVRGKNLREYMDELLYNDGVSFFYRYVPEPSNADIGLNEETTANDTPRVLFLGDSVSKGVWAEALSLQEEQKAQQNSKQHFIVHGAPNNCGGFENYGNFLDDWLGVCPWDLIQFNVGMHFHPEPETGLNAYRDGLEFVIERLQKHSPNAKIVLAFTTPSPFDSEDTWPDRNTCKNYGKFHPKGFVTQLNAIAKEVAEEYGLTYNDRYTVIQPVLSKYQHVCDIHFNPDGYRLLAEHDLKLTSWLLNGQNGA